MSQAAARPRSAAPAGRSGVTDGRLSRPAEDRSPAGCPEFFRHDEMLTVRLIVAPSNGRRFPSARRGRSAVAHPRQRHTQRLDRDIAVRFKADGPGWQTRITAALREWIVRRWRAGPPSQGRSGRSRLRRGHCARPARIGRPWPPWPYCDRKGVCNDLAISRNASCRAAVSVASKACAGSLAQSRSIFCASVSSTISATE